jgi:long-chain acyl-CoA synthetase
MERWSDRVNAPIFHHPISSSINNMLVHNFLENSAARLPEKVALICDGQRLTYQQINHSADQLARYLIDIGVKRQDRVVIFLDNSAESIISLFGVLKVGAIFIILNPTMKSKKLNYILRDSGARTLVTDTNKVRVVKNALSEVPELHHIVWCQKLPSHKIPQLDISESQLKISGTWFSVFEHVSTACLPNYTIDLDLATIIYTSGSTGEPKGVMSAHYNVVAAASSIIQYLENVEDDIIMSALPLSFDYGLYQVLMAFLFGGTVVLEKSFSYPYKVIEKLIQEKATGFPIVPTMVAILLQMEHLSKFDLSRLRYITNTAAALPVAYIRKLQALFPYVKIYSMYGLTECKRTLYLPPDQLDRRPDSVGIAIPNEEVFIVNEDGQEVGPGEVGELVVRGSNVMQGYWNAPEETARVYRPGRYRADTLLYTGDLFRKDEEGFLYFVARKDDMIKTKGERVSPKEIEDALCEMDGVVEAAVIGVPEEIFGQAIKAFIVTKEKSNLSEKMIMKYCTKNLEPFMVPKYIEFMDSLPKTPNGKVDKKKLS